VTAADSSRDRIVDVVVKGRALLRDPLLNKGTAFSADERRELELEGLLPAQTKNIEQQARRIYRQLEQQSDDLQKYMALSALEGRNLHLFQKVLGDHLEELMPIVYTPTVGLATQRFSHVFQGGRGVFITPDMRGRMADVLRLAIGARTVRLLVVTDNESILGLGDQGAGGMAISIGKLALYTAGAGIHPAECMPVSLDFGTENEELLRDEQYLGWPSRRLRGAPYYELVEEFVAAVEQVCPGALIQWEDFRKDNALAILDRYADRLPSFNDDIQGTGAVVLAGVANALLIKRETLAEQRIVVLGAGAAGLGITRQVRAELAEQGVAELGRLRAVAVLDRGGLLVSGARAQDGYKRELAWPESLAASFGLEAPTRRGLFDVVRQYRPSILIGVSGQANAFDEQTVREMARHVERPVIFPSSNPVTNSEARPQDLIEWTDGKALVAAGSPFAPVVHAGRTVRVGQGNNVFIFPGLGLGAIVSGARKVTSGMIAAASHELAHRVTDEERASGLLFPSVGRLRSVSLAVAIAVARRAIAEGAAEPAAADIDAAVRTAMWEPIYPRYRLAAARDGSFATR
jgi:malic enzyme